MKVVYKKTILDKLHEKKIEAERSRKKIDYFLLTPKELNELRAVSSYELTPTYHYNGWDNPNPADSVSFETVDLWSGYRKTRFIFQHYTVLDERIVVAPKEYHQ